MIHTLHQNVVILRFLICILNCNSKPVSSTNRASLRVLWDFFMFTAWSVILRFIIWSNVRIQIARKQYILFASKNHVIYRTSQNIFNELNASECILFSNLMWIILALFTSSIEKNFSQIELHSVNSLKPGGLTFCNWRKTYLLHCNLHKITYPTVFEVAKSEFSVRIANFYMSDLMWRV